MEKHNSLEIVKKLQLDMDDIHFFTSRSGPRNPKIIWNAEFRFTDSKGQSHHFLHTEDTFEEVVERMLNTLKDSD